MKGEGLQLLQAREILRQRRAAPVVDGALTEIERQALQLLQAAEHLRQRRAAFAFDVVPAKIKREELHLPEAAKLLRQRDAAPFVIASDVIVVHVDIVERERKGTQLRQAAKPLR